MTIVERVKNICLTPNTEWPVIAQENTPPGSLVAGYVAPLVAIGAVAGFIGGSIIGLPFIGRTPFFLGIGAAILNFVLTIIGVFVIALIINALAPSFGGEKNMMQAFKVAAYSFTPGWVAGVLRILPLLGVLAVLAALYGLYLLYLGLPRLMKSPEDKALGYTVVVVIVAIVVYVCIGAVTAVIGGAALIGSGALSGISRSSGSSSDDVHFDKNSPLGKLEELGKKLEESNKKVEAAQKSGDTGAAGAAALEGLGTLLGGGKRVDPVGIAQLTPFVPAAFAGLPKTSSNAEKTGITGLMVSKAEASYGDNGGKHARLEVSDTGGMSGLVGLVGWAGIQGEKEDDDVSERTQKVAGRLQHEKISKRGGGSNEFAIVLGDRFVVSATGYGVSLSELKSAVSQMDLATLEGMKDVGVQK